MVATRILSEMITVIVEDKLSSLDEESKVDRTKGRGNGAQIG